MTGTQEIVWGPAIAVDGKRPGFVRDDDWVHGLRRDADGREIWQTTRSRWRDYRTLEAIRLHADHPHYRQPAPIDWSGELEAVHEDGRVVAVTLVTPFLWGGSNPDNDGQWWTTDPHNPGCKMCWSKDGERKDKGWRIRNVTPQPTPQTDTKPDLTARMEALDWFSSQRRLSLAFRAPFYGDDDDQTEEWQVSEESGSINDREWHVVGRGGTAIDAIMAARAALLPEPVDPDYAALKQIMDDYDGAFSDDVNTTLAWEIAYKALARGRELALAGETGK